jgi:hypothetical protein
MAKKHKPNNRMKGSNDMHSEEPDIIENDFVEAPAPTPEPVVEVPASEPVSAPAPAPAPEPAAETKQESGKLMNVDIFGRVRHITIPNMK